MNRCQSMSRDQPEHRLSHWVSILIARCVQEPCWFSAIDHSGRAIGGSPQSQMAWRHRQKWMGITPSHLDWYIYQSTTGKYAQFELKIGSNKPDLGQITTMQLLRE